MLLYDTLVTQLHMLPGVSPSIASNVGNEIHVPFQLADRTRGLAVVFDRHVEITLGERRVRWAELEVAARQAQDGPCAKCGGAGHLHMHPCECRPDFAGRIA